MEWQRWRYVLPLRLRSLFRRTAADLELDEELRFHLECKTEEAASQGFDAREARYRALRAMGGIEQRKEEMRDMRGVGWFTDSMADLKFVLRTLSHAKPFTILVVMTLGLGIGVNSAMFSVADAVLLRPLPVPRASQIVTLSSFTPSSATESVGAVSYRNFTDVRNGIRSFEGLAAYTFASNFGFADRRGELPTLKGGILVSGNLFQVMHVEPQLGRAFTPEEDRAPGRNAVVVLSDQFWQGHFGGDRSVLGKRLLLNGVEFSVIGVAPKKFTGLDAYVRPDLFVPIMMWPRLFAGTNRDPLNDRGDRELIVKGRLKPGVTFKQAAAELDSIAVNLRRAYPKTNRNLNFALRTEFATRLHDDPSDAALVVVLLALAGAVLLISTANVTSLLLGRARSRSREIAVRLAIGADRSRLLRLLLVESLVFALLGGIAGTALGYGGVRFFSRFQMPTELPLRLSFQLDRRVLLFSLVVSLLSAILCGLAPALQTTRTNLVTAIKTANAEVPGRRKLWGRNTLVICQVAASLCLLIAALQLVQTFERKWRNGPGFRTNQVLTMSFDPTLTANTEAQTKNFYKALVRGVRQLQGVNSAALTGSLPMANEVDGIGVIPQDFTMPRGRESFPIDIDVVDTGYFETFGVELVAGRTFRETDTANSPAVAVVNEQFAKRFWPKSNALGKRFRLSDSSNSSSIEIVGISKTAKYDWIGEPPTPFFYLPFAQRSRDRMTLLVQSQRPTGEVAEAVRQVVRNLDSRQPVSGVRTIEEYYYKRVLAAPIMIIQVVIAMGLIGLILALSGLYGLVSFSAGQRTREIGIRMAVGADRTGILRMVLRKALILVATGIAIGLPLGLAVGRGLNSIFQSPGVELRPFLVIIPAMLAVTMVAAFIPARRASQLEPIRALRYE